MYYFLMLLKEEKLLIVQGTLTKCDFAKVRRIATLLNAIKKRNNEAKRLRV